MVLSIMTLAVVTPLLATSTLQLQETAQKQQQEQQGQQEQQFKAKEEAEELKTEKHHLRVRASDRMGETEKEEMKDRVVVLSNGKLFLKKSMGAQDHPFTGYFLPYPERAFDGVVTTIDKQNMLNWIYIDQSTLEVKYGTRAVSDNHFTGPMSTLNMEGGEMRLVCYAREGFRAVMEGPDSWALYFDKEDNNLNDKYNMKWIIEVGLIRDTSEETKARLQESETA